jgi:putative transposase
LYLKAREKGLPSERALTMSLAEMYIKGVSNRKVTAILEQLCVISIPAAQVSKAAVLLDGTYRAWRQKLLCEFPYLILDAR